jgi:hypothetical protein
MLLLLFNSESINAREVMYNSPKSAGFSSPKNWRFDAPYILDFLGFSILRYPSNPPSRLLKKPAQITRKGI